MRQFASQNPDWQYLVVDLRQHGDSEKLISDSNTLEDCGRDLIELMERLDVAPKQVWGHSFGGKVGLVFAQMLPTPPETVWVLDAIPGPSNTGALNAAEHSVVAVIKHLQQIPLPIASRNQLKEQLLKLGFSKTMAGWMTTNLEPAGTQSGGFVWRFNLNAIPQMLSSYGQYDCWPLIDRLVASHFCFPGHKTVLGGPQKFWLSFFRGSPIQAFYSMSCLTRALGSCDSPNLARNLQNFL